MCAQQMPVAWVHLPFSKDFATVLQFLQHRYAHVPAQRWVERIQANEVRFENGAPITLSTPYQGNCRVRYAKSHPQEPRIPFEVQVVYENEHIVVASKPHFLPVVPGAEFIQESLVYRLRQELELPELSPAHRLDRDTAGLVLLCKYPAQRGAYQRLFQSRAVHKRYLAIAHTQAPLPPTETQWIHRIAPAPTPAPWFAMSIQPGEANAVTQVRHCIALGDNKALLCLEPITGRKHQLRVQAAHMGFPLLYDRFYPHMQPKAPDNYEEPLQLLASELAFRDPISGALLHFQSPHTLKYGGADVLRLPALLC